MSESLILPGGQELLNDKILEEKKTFAIRIQENNIKKYEESINILSGRLSILREGLESLSPPEFKALTQRVEEKARKRLLLWGGVNIFLVFIVTILTFVLSHGHSFSSTRITNFLGFIIISLLLNGLIFFADGSDGITHHPPKTLPTIIDLLLCKRKIEKENPTKQAP